MNKKGFTLVELLAVIVILAIILAIAVPSVTSITTNATKSAFEDDAKLILKAVDYQTLQDSSFDATSISSTNINTKLGVGDTNYDTVQVGTISGERYIVITGKNKWAGYKACGTRGSMNVVVSTDTTTCQDINPPYDSSKGVNRPQLATGMVPIKWNGSSWVDTTASDSAWYDYTTKQWANARTADGSMWVWIPRYIYRISSGWHSSTTGTIDIQFSKDTNDNWNSGTITLDTGTISNASNNKYTNHPAFTFGTIELTGIWVAKFEATAAEGVVNPYSSDGSCPSGSDNVTTKTIKSIPNAISWRCIKISNMFTNIRNMETNSVYGWPTSSGLQVNGDFTTDTNNLNTHLMKNVEWGVVAYLSKSTYGQNTNEIWINPADSMTTGCAGDSASSTQTVGCLRTYDTTNGQKASTTGNIYGIYDMSGGAYEYTAAYVNNGNSNLTTYGNSMAIANAKYKDLYPITTDSDTNNYTNAISLKGDAIYEISSSYTGSTSWFGDYSYMPNTSAPWFVHGGRFNNGSGAGAFSFGADWGASNSDRSFRPVLLVNAGL